MTQYVEGTVAVTAGSQLVVGTGTSFVGEVSEGHYFSVTGSNVWYTVASVSDDTHLTLSANYIGVDRSAVSYQVHRDFTARGLPLISPTDRDVISLINRAMMGIDAAQSEAEQGTVALRDLIGSVSQDITGFPNLTDSVLTFDDSTRTVTVSPVGDTHTVYYRGEALSLGELAIQIVNTSGPRYIIINPETGLLTEAGTAPGFASLLTAYIYWNAAQGKFVIKGDERHGASRDTNWHRWTHMNSGMVWRTGGSISYTLDDASEIGLGVSTPLTIADEDVEFTVVHEATPSAPFHQPLEGTAALPVLSVGADGFIESVDGPYRGTPIAYNPVTDGIGAQTAVPNGKYVNYFVVATNSQEDPIKTIQGRFVYDTAEEARGEVVESYGLSLSEMVAMYQVILVRDDTISANTHEAKIAAVYRAGRSSTGGTATFSATDHQALSGRSEAGAHPISSIVGLQEELDSKASSHLELIGRDAVDSHPIAAITGLQTALDGKASSLQGSKADSALQPADVGVSVQSHSDGLDSLAEVGTAADKVPCTTGAGVWGEADLTAAGRALIGAEDVAAQRTALGLTGAGLVSIQVITEAGFYVKPAWLRFVGVYAVGGGAGGGGALSGGGAGEGGGGGAGEFAFGWFAATELGASVAVTPGAAGPGGTPGNNSGTAGGVTSFGTLLIANGGLPGSGSGNTAASGVVAGGLGGTGGIGGLIRIPGGSGSHGRVASALPSLRNAGGSACGPYGGSGGAPSSGTYGGPGGDATGYGGGGAGGSTQSATSRAGGDGFQGVCVVFEYG